MTIASTLLHSGRTSTGLSQRALATATHTDHPAVSTIEKGTRDPSVGLLDRLLRGTGHSLVSVPTRAFPASVYVDEIRVQLLAGRDEAAFRTFLSLNDSLGLVTPGLKVVLTISDPGTTGSPRFDALIAGLAEHVLDRGHLPVPEWTEDPSRFLVDDWFVDDSPYARAHDRETAPRAFVRRGVILAATELEST